MKQTVANNFLTPVSIPLDMDGQEVITELSKFHRGIEEIMVKGAKHEIEIFDEDGNFVKMRPIGYSLSNSIYGHTKELIKHINKLKQIELQIELRKAS